MKGRIYSAFGGWWFHCSRCEQEWPTEKWHIARWYADIHARWHRMSSA